MTDPTSPDLAGDEPDLGATYLLTPYGWESADYQEPARDWRLLDDGTYESPDGLTRTFARAEPAEWSDAARPADR